MHRRLRVLFAIGSMGAGGAERQIVEILKHLDRSRFEPLLYLLSPEGALLGELPGDVSLLCHSDRQSRRRFRWPGWYQRAVQHDLAAILNEQRIDVLYDRTYLMTLIAAGATRLTPVPRVSVCVVDPAPELEEHARFSVWSSRRAARRAYREATCVVTNSQGLRKRLLEYFGLDPDLVRVVPNIIDIQRIDRLADEPFAGFEPRRFHIVSMGRLHPQKGYQYLIEALDQVVHRSQRSEVLWHLFGTGPEEAVLKAEVKSRDLERNVRFEGFHRNPFPFVRAAQLFCLPSLYEGLPNVLIEAAICRTPLLATDCPSGPGEILDGGRLGRLVPPADAAALAVAIDDCISRYDDWRKLTEAARLHAEATYSLPSGMALLEQLLADAASGKLWRVAGA